MPFGNAVRGESATKAPVVRVPPITPSAFRRERRRRFASANIEDRMLTAPFSSFPDPSVSPARRCLVA
jgi:hypothetical protein